MKPTYRFHHKVHRCMTPELFKTLDERDREVWEQIVEEIDRDREQLQTD